MRIRILLISVIAAITAVTAGTGVVDAGKKAGVEMPDTFTIANKHLVLNGMGLREATFLKVDVYVAGLYVEHASSNPTQIINSNEVKVMAMRFVRDVDRSDIVKAWNEGFAHNATVPVAQIKPQLDQLNAWMPKFHDGDVLSFIYVPDKGVEVQINGVRKGILPGVDFERSLFSVWLGPKPPTGDLKRGLLGRHPSA